MNALPRYVDRVTELLQQKLKQSQLLALKKELMVQRGKAAQFAQNEAPLPSASRPPGINVFQIEADISKRYNGRPVNLMGTSL